MAFNPYYVPGVIDFVVAYDRGNLPDIEECMKPILSSLGLNATFRKIKEDRFRIGSSRGIDAIANDNNLTPDSIVFLDGDKNNDYAGVKTAADLRKVTDARFIVTCYASQHDVERISTLLGQRNDADNLQPSPRNQVSLMFSYHPEVVEFLNGGERAQRYFGEMSALSKKGGGKTETQRPKQDRSIREVEPLVSEASIRAHQYNAYTGKFEGDPPDPERIIRVTRARALPLVSEASIRAHQYNAYTGKFERD